MVRKFKFVRYSHIEEEKIALYVTWLNSDGSLKSEVSHFKNLRFSNFLALDPNFFLAESLF